VKKIDFPEQTLRRTKFVNGCFKLDDDSKDFLGKWLEITISIHLKLVVFSGSRIPGRVKA